MTFLAPLGILFFRVSVRTRVMTGLAIQLSQGQGRQPLAFSGRVLSLLTDGVSRLQTSESNSTFWPSCHGHTLLPNWSKASPPTRHGGAHDHHRFYHRLILPGR